MDYKFEIIETKAQPALSIRNILTVENMPEAIGNAYGTIISYLGELGEQPVDMPFTAYYSEDMNIDMQNLDVEIGLQVSKELPGRGEIISNPIPAGKKATCMYKGTYSEMTPAYEAMTKWMNENGHEPAGVVYEFYYNSPMEVPESELLTKIVFILKQ